MGKPEEADSLDGLTRDGAPFPAGSKTSRTWGGRFSEPAEEIARRFTASIGFDQRLASVDIIGSMAHARMLGRCGIISEADSKSIVDGLAQLLEEVRSGAVSWDIAAEDIHMNVEQRLRERIGEVAGRLHTARSRNDQVATDTRLWLRGEIDALFVEVGGLQRTLLDLSERRRATVIPGYTHTQHAQPVLLSHHLLAYFWMLERDVERLTECRRRVNVLPLGSAALAGTPHPIDRSMLARELGFDEVAPNSMDAVSDRDFAIEAIADASLIMTHLSRLCNELVLWQSREFGFVMMADSMTTGSSIMPQKKNPDVAELVRGKTGRVYGDLVALLTVMKGLPLTYNSDMQEDKERLFDAIDTVRSCIRVVDRLLQTTRFEEERMGRAVRGDASTATDLADALVRRGLPFRQAHEIVGRIVKEGERRGIPIEEWSLEDLQSFYPELEEKERACLRPESSVAARVSYGGAAPERVAEQLALARDRWESRWKNA